MLHQYWFDNLNEALESESLVDLWPLCTHIKCDENKTIIVNGRVISIYRGTNGRYERPIHYSTYDMW